MKLNEPGRQKEKQQKQHHQKESEIEENVYVAKQNNKAGKFCPTPLSSAPQGGRGRERERELFCAVVPFFSSRLSVFPFSFYFLYFSSLSPGESPLRPSLPSLVLKWTGRLYSNNETETFRVEQV